MSIEAGTRPIDADNHYYESLDACTRHLDPEFKRRGVRIVQQGKRTLALMGDQVNHFIPNPTFDPIIVPGCLDPMFRGQVPEGVDPRTLLQVEPIHPEYRDHDARVRVLDEQGIDGALLFPTFACGVEQGLRFDIPALMATLHAFNCWLEEDWGFAYQDRLFAAPMLCVSDPDAALEEVDSLIERGARVVHMRPAPVPAPNGRGRSLGDPLHDPVWARLAEASMPVAFHLGDSGYEAIVGVAWGGAEYFEPFRPVDPFAKLLVSDRAIHDTIGSMIAHRVFTRHPKLRVASIENGSDWVHILVKRLRKQANQTPWLFDDDPLETLKRHVWVAPYFEEDIRKLADTIGVDRVLFGSDWPHGEGLSDPLAFEKELDAFTADEASRIMRANVLELLRPAA